jgi:cysteine desulfurase
MPKPLIPYLDAMASTPIDPLVVEAMLPYMTEHFGNPDSKHAYGTASQVAIAHARAQVAQAIGATPESIHFTSGATEAINLALKGAAHFYRKSGKHIITLQTEHAATLASCAQLENAGYDLTYLPPNRDGLLSPDTLQNALRPDTILVSISHVNSEIGVVQDIATIANIVAENGALLHIDAAQSIGKCPLDVRQYPIAMLSLSAHKCHGPKGIGALYLRQKPKVHLQALLHGGTQEAQYRAGTLATHQIIGMGAAYAIATTHMTDNLAHVQTLANALRAGLETIPDIQINGCLQQRVPHNLNVTFHGVPGDHLFAKLQLVIAVSSGSACNSHKLTISPVLQALGLSRAEANATIRYSLSKMNTLADIHDAITATKRVVAELRNPDNSREN